jgi:hypothetical protein
MTDEARIAKALELGWTHIYIATGPSTNPRCAGIRSVESGPREGDERLMGTPPGQWQQGRGGSGTGSGPAVDLPG